MILSQKIYFTSRLRLLWKLHQFCWLVGRKHNFKAQFEIALLASVSKYQNMLSEQHGELQYSSLSLSLSLSLPHSYLYHSLAFVEVDLQVLDVAY